MTVKPSPSVVGVFSDRSLAEQAIEALQTSGFHNEDISYSAPGSASGFFQDLKSLFTGSSPGSGQLTSDLTAMGLPDEEARYYANEYSSGNAVLAVKAGDRVQDVLSIMHRYGAYHARTSSSFYGQPEATPEQPNDANVQGQESAQSQTVEEEVSPQPQTDVEPDESSSEHVETYPETPYTDRAEDVEHQPEASTTTAEPDVDEYQPPETTTESGIEKTQYQTEPELKQAGVTEYESQAMSETEEGTVQTPSSVAPEHSTTYQAPTYTATQTADVPYEHSDQLRLLQDQLKNAQQQLQEAKAKLQKAKEHEQELQSVRQQLEEVQKELDATMSELQETQNRIVSYR